jgi:hypothetical protein
VKSVLSVLPIFQFSSLLALVGIKKFVSGNMTNFSGKGEVRILSAST